MPIYTYKCNACGIELTKRFDLRDKAPQSCDEVNHNGCAGTLTKLVSSTHFALKGAAWYRDGYFKQK